MLGRMDAWTHGCMNAWTHGRNKNKIATAAAATPAVAAAAAVMPADPTNVNLAN